MVNLNTGEGWSTKEEFDSPEPTGSTGDVGGNEDFVTPATAPTCGSCGTAVTFANSREMLGEATSRARRVARHACAHSDLVRSVVMGDHWVASGGYDSTVKVRSRYFVHPFRYLRTRFRFGTERRALLWLNWRAGIRDASSALASTVPRSVRHLLLPTPHLLEKFDRWFPLVKIR